MSEVIEDETVRVERLLDAQAKAEQLFAETVRRDLIRAGVGERQLSDQIRDLAAEMLGVSRHWHKRVVRAGANTLAPYAENPPDRVITDDDIVFLDFGPIFEEWEADFGRTYVLGDDPLKHKLRDDLPLIWHRGLRHFEDNPDVTGEQLYAHVLELTHDAGWEFGSPIAGHLLGQFPHEKIAGDTITHYIAPGSTQPMRRVDRNGRRCHWILEVHLVDREHRFGGFFEELLDIGHHRSA